MTSQINDNRSMKNEVIKEITRHLITFNLTTVFEREVYE